MRINLWKIATISLVGILLLLAYSGRPVAAQYGSGETYHITKATSADLSSSGSVRVSGEIKGFACVADVRGDLMKGDGDINSTVSCYVLSK
jgi:hypothetical protein